MALLPVLYSFRRCPYAMRARLALASSGQNYELREVSLRSKPPELLAASNKGTVPVLVLPGGEVIDESLDVMRWALRQHDPEGWLQPSESTLLDMAALIAANDGPFKQQLDRYKYPNRYASENGGDLAGFAQSHRDEAAIWLTGLQQRLVRHAWLFGKSVSLADMAILPFVRQFARTDARWFAAQPWPQLVAWLASFETGARYRSVMEKQPPWQSTAS